MRKIFKELAIAVALTIALAVVVCGVYPWSVFVLAQGLFPEKANGSVIYYNGMLVGSELLGQHFESTRYFHPRPSMAGTGYDGMASGGSNLGPTSKDLVNKVQERVMKYRKENSLLDSVPVPADAVMASGSGLDPHISVENARLQVGRVAQARGWETAKVDKLVPGCTEGRNLAFLGESRVNVLLLNLALDREEKGGK